MLQSIQAGSLIPIVCCSAKTGVGLSELLSALALCVPSPADFRRTAMLGRVDHDITADPAGPLVAQVFKTRIDPFVQKLSYVRIF